MDDTLLQDICRVCRSEGAPDRPLYHPCVCTGSIRYIHQDCLVQWLKYSKKEYCELCKHKFAFRPIYSPDMPKRLPIRDIVSGLLKSLARAVRYWFQSTLVALAWLGVVPLTACRIYRCLFTGSVSSLLTLPLDMLSTENVLTDCFQGCFVVTCTLCAFISLVWLREQILHGGGPDWVLLENRANRQANVAAAQPEAVPAPVNQAQVPVNQPAAPNPNNVAVVPAQGANEDAAGAGGNAGAAAQPAEPNWDNVANDNVAAAQNNANNGDNEWNPIEWDRAAEELTWERLLGLDGSLVFLEHVFWVVSLNTLFILVFAFCPYHIGRFTIMGLKIEKYFQVTQFEGLLTALLGYMIIAVSLVILHTSASAVRLLKFKRIMGLCYIVVKVSLLIVIEIGMFPLICGLWLDICSLSMFETSLKERQTSFKLAPGTSMFIHWLVGMVYVFYFASFILLLREVLRPGVLWFLRNLNDPDFNPIHEMIHLPVYRHIRRFLASMVIFGSSVLLMLWAPVKIIRYVFSSFLPYNVMLSSDAPVSELSLELLLLQVVLPALLEQGHTRHWLKSMIRGWCVAISWCLDLRSYLLGDVPLEDIDGEAGQPRFDLDLAAADDDVSDDENAPEVENDVVLEDVENVNNEQNNDEENEGNNDLIQPNNDQNNDGENEGYNDLIQPYNEQYNDGENEGNSDLIQPNNVQNIDGENEANNDLIQPNNVQNNDGENEANNDLIQPNNDGENEANNDLIQPNNDGENERNNDLQPIFDEVDAIIDAMNPIIEPLPEINVIPPAPAVPGVVAAAPQGAQGLGAAHQALLMGGGPIGFQPYRKPSLFALRVFCLFVMMCFSLFVTSILSYIVPVWLGRQLMRLWMKETKVHELYTAACGLYACWLVLRAASITSHWIPQGWHAIWARIKEWVILGAKSVVVAFLLVGVVPLLLGILFELIMVVPIRVPIDQSPVFFPWQDWALGVLHAKIVCAATMMGPHWGLRRAIEQVYNQGWRNMDLGLILKSLCAPVIGVLGMCICLPYIVARSIVPLFDLGFETENLVLRRIYPSLLCFFLFMTYLVFQIKQFKKLYEHIKNDKYLVGQRLVNYDRRISYNIEPSVIS